MSGWELLGRWTVFVGVLGCLGIALRIGEGLIGAEWMAFVHRLVLAVLFADWLGRKVLP